MDSNAVASRAALDAARAVFGTMTSTSAPSDAATSTASGRALAAWRAAESILRAVTGRTDLTGQALVGEARRTDRLTLGDAHVLVALFGWMERLQDPAKSDSGVPSAPTDQERSVAREALLALEHAVATVQREAARDGARDDSRDAGRDLTGSSMGDLTRGARATDPFAPPAASSGPSWGPSSYERPRATADRAAAPAAGASPPLVDPVGTTTGEYDPMPRRRRTMSPAMIIGAVALLLLAAAGTWYGLSRRNGSAYDEGTVAYTRGSREAARIAFARAAQDKPDDPRPLIYLGRIAREDGDLARARRFLESAVRLAPGSAVAQREMASTMLADGNPEIARRFYVRALEIDPTDRLAQGFLACALHRLGRFDDARRFVERAGPGEWTPCLSTPVTPVMPGALPPGTLPPGAVPPGAQPVRPPQ